MDLSNLFFVLFLAHGVFAIPGAIEIESCDTKENFPKCVKEDSQYFFSKYCDDNAEYRWKSTDPLIIPSLDIRLEEFKGTNKYSNIKVTGFKNVIVTDTKADKDLSMFEHTLKFNLVAECDITSVFDSGKTFSGTAKFEGGIEGDVRYTLTSKLESYNNITIERESVFVTCNADNVKFTLDPALAKAVQEDAAGIQSTPDYEKKFNDAIVGTVRAIGNAVLKTAVGNLRAAAQYVNSRQ